MKEEEFNVLWTSFVRRSHGDGSRPLSECERHFYSVNLLRGSIPRSGFIAYFEGSTGQDILNAHGGLKALGLDSVLVLVEQAEALAFGGKPIPSDSSYVEIFSDSLTENEYEVAMDRLDEALGPISEEFYTQDEVIRDALCKYADENNLKPIS